MKRHNNLDFSTRAVHVGNEVDKETGSVRRPITMANSYALPYDPTDMNWSSADANLYTRNGGANQKYLQEKLAFAKQHLIILKNELNQKTIRNIL